MCVRAQNFPDQQYPSIVGRPILRTEEQAPGDIVLKDIMCGDEAAAARSMLQITYPVRLPPSFSSLVERFIGCDTREEEGCAGENTYAFGEKTISLLLHLI